MAEFLAALLLRDIIALAFNVLTLLVCRYKVQKALAKGIKDARLNSLQ